MCGSILLRHLVLYVLSGFSLVTLVGVYLILHFIELGTKSSTRARTQTQTQTNIKRRKVGNVLYNDAFEKKKKKKKMMMMKERKNERKNEMSLVTYIGALVYGNDFSYRTLYRS